MIVQFLLRSVLNNIHCLQPKYWLSVCKRLMQVVYLIVCACVFVNGYALLVWVWHWLHACMHCCSHALTHMFILYCTYVPACLMPDVVCVSFSQANYSVPENGGMAEFMVVADKEFTFTFQVEVNIMPVTAQCKHFLCQMSVLAMDLSVSIAISHFAQAFSLPLSSLSLPVSLCASYPLYCYSFLSPDSGQRLCPRVSQCHLWTW